MRQRNNLERHLVIFIFTCVMQCMASSAFGEAGDRDKPINISADKGFEDNKKQEAVFEGNVVLTQGTLRVDANRIVVRRDKNGFEYATATGSPAHLRQKREGLDEYVDGFAQRIEYNGKEELLQLFDDAKLKRGSDELTSNYIQYNSRTEVFQAFGPGQKEASKSEGGRVKAVIQPQTTKKPE